MILFGSLVAALGLASAVTYYYNNYVATNELQVKTTRGWVEGGYATTRGGKKIMQYLGIPYGKSPVKELSFRDPVEADMWGGVKKVTKEGMQQFELDREYNNEVNGRVNCLYVNVYTPKATTSTKLPVIFFIHGGGFVGLPPDKLYFGPEMLLDQDVVLVTASFRVGVLGYLSTEDSVIPGNWGLKDQALALRWVKNNIHKFGGDPNSITLMGEDSGAASVHLHMISPQTKELFQRAIMHSASGLNLWGVAEPGVLKERAEKVAGYVGCPFHPSEEFLECLQKTDPEKIVETTNKFLVFDNDPWVVWNPVVESAALESAFIVQSPITQTSKKPLLAGYNYAEGMMKVSSMIAGNAEVVNSKFQKWNDEFDSITPVTLMYDKIVTWSADVTKKVNDFYLPPQQEGSDRPGTDTASGSAEYIGRIVPPLNRLFGDFWFTNGLLDAVEKHTGPKYLYHFNYNTTDSMCKKMHNTEVYGGACHMDELMYLFPMAFEAHKIANPQSTDYKLSLQMVELWVNFAKNSVPTANGITWNPVTSSQMEHLQITNGGFTMNMNPIGDRRAFWKSLNLRQNA